MLYQNKMLDKEATCKKIRSIICQSGYTIDELSYQLGLTTSRSIYNWINGHKLPGVESLYNMAKLFNMKMEDFLVMR